MQLYKVTLADEERNMLREIVKKGGKGYKIKHANILLKLDALPENDGLTYAEIGRFYNARRETVGDVAKRFVTEGFEKALGRKEQMNRARKVTGEVEAKLIAIACSAPPKGRSRWTCQLIADELIRLEIIDYITDTTVCEVMRSNELKPWQVKEWCIPTADAEYVARMEDVIDLYHQPYDPFYPVVCLDETNKQLIKVTRIPCSPGNVEKVDSEYERNGVVDVFMAFEPLAVKRITMVTSTRTAVDFAVFLKKIADVYWAHAIKIRLVMDNLNTHLLSSLYKVFKPAEARRIAQKFELHYTPKHGSWLNMAEIEIGVMSRQALEKPLSTCDDFKKQVYDWNAERNKASLAVDWQFTTDDARTKLKRLYPVLEEN